MHWNVICFAFAVNGQQPDFVILLFEVVDNSRATPFTFPCHCPTEFSYTTRTRNNFPRFWIPEQEALEAHKLIISQISVNIFSKSSRLNEYHIPIIRLCRTKCNRGEDMGSCLLLLTRKRKDFRDVVQNTQNSKGRRGQATFVEKRSKGVGPGI